MDNLTSSTIVQDNLSLYSTTEQVFMFLCGGLLSLLTVSGNLLVLIAYYRNKRLRNVTNLLLMSLSFSDILVALVPLNFYLIYCILGYWPFGPILCDIYLILDYVLCQISILHLVLICIDRYKLMTDPISYTAKRTKKGGKVAVFIVWILALVQWCPAIIGYQYIVGERTVPETKCYAQMLLELWYLSYGIALTAYYIPVIFITVVYLRLYYLIKKRLKTNAVQQGKESSHQTSSGKGVSSTNEDSYFSKTDISKDEAVSESCELKDNTNEFKKERKFVNKHRRAAKMLTIVCVAFTITWLPYNIHVIIAPICLKCFSKVSWDLAYMCCYLNSTINPICYAWGSPAFRKEFKEILGWKCGNEIMFIQTLKKNKSKKTFSKICRKQGNTD